MPIYKQSTEITNIDDLLSSVERDIEEVYFGDKQVFTVWGEYDGTLPATYTANGNYLADYRIYGAAGGVGDDSGTANGYVVPMSVSDGTTSTTTPIYIGNDPLGEDEYVDYGSGKIYRMSGGVLTPTDPPVPLPELPTVDGVTITDYAGQSAAPSKFYAKYRKEGY